MQSTDSVQTFRGKGRLFHNGQMVMDGARYVVHIITPRDPAAPGAVRLEGVMMSDVPFALLRQPIELELEDRRRWLCVMQSTSGDLVDRGGLQSETPHAG